MTALVPTVGTRILKSRYPFVRPTGWAVRSLQVLGVLLLLASFSSAQSNEPKEVLILMQEDLSWPIFRHIDENIRVALLHGAPDGILIFSEPMDRIHFPDPKIQALRTAWIQRKYANSKLDLIIGVGDVPLDIFPNVPLIYLCPSPAPKVPAGLALRKDVSRIDVQLGARKTLQAALRLQPTAQRVVVIGGSSPSELLFLDQVREQLSGFSDRLRIDYLTDIGLPEIRQKVRALGPESIVLFVTLGRDADGRPLISADVISKLAADSGAPVYTLLDTHLGTGAVGGFVTRLGEMGTQAGEMGLRVLAGEHPKDEVAPAGFTFDGRQLQRWKIPESVIPPGSIVHNRQLNIWEAYRWYILGVLFLCLAEALLIFALLWHRARRKRVEASLADGLKFEHLLSDLSTTFINLPESQVIATIENSLGRIANFLHIERIAVHEYSRGIAELTATISWREDGRELGPLVVKADQLPWWKEVLDRGEALFVSEATDLPEQASLEKDYLNRIKAISIAAIPLKAGDDFLGCLSFISTNRKILWTDELRTQLKLLGQIVSNVLERKRANHLLRESEQRFRLVANTAPVLIWMAGTDKHCTFFNQSWLNFTGRALAEEVGSGWVSGVHPDDHDRCLETYFAAFDSRREFQMEYRLLRFDGVYRWLVDLGVPRFEADGTFCGYVGSCVDITERRTSEESLHQLTGRLICAQEEERARIARELHDDFSQRLALLSIGLGQLWKELPESEPDQRASILEMIKGLKEISSDIHSLSHELHSSKLEHVGLVPALQGLCREFGEKHQIAIHFRNPGPPVTLSKDVALCLFRIAQEALGNAAKHSGAAEACMELSSNDSAVTLRISDSGAGFDSDTQNLFPGIGLIGMSERLRFVGGALYVRSSPGSGTEVIAEVPQFVTARESQSMAQAAEA
jgi:PAS domain S-box-containing protein